MLLTRWRDWGLWGKGKISNAVSTGTITGSSTWHFLTCWRSRATVSTISTWSRMQCSTKSTKSLTPSAISICFKKANWHSTCTTTTSSSSANWTSPSKTSGTKSTADSKCKSGKISSYNNWNRATALQVFLNFSTKASKSTCRQSSSSPSTRSSTLPSPWRISSAQRKAKYSNSPICNFVVSGVGFWSVFWGKLNLWADSATISCRLKSWLINFGRSTPKVWGFIRIKSSSWLSKWKNRSKSR